MLQNLAIQLLLFYHEGGTTYLDVAILRDEVTPTSERRRLTVEGGRRRVSSGDNTDDLLFGLVINQHF